MTIRRTIPLIIIVLIALNTQIVSAQDDVPSPTPNVPTFLYDWEVQNFYPAAIRFNIVIDRVVTDIQQLVLTLQLDAETTVSLPIVPQEAAVFSDEFTEISYLWEIPAEDVPAFNSRVTYSWLVTTRTDGTAGAPGEFVFTDPTYEWIEDRNGTNGLNILKTEDTVSPEDIHETVAPVLELLAENIGEQRELNVLLLRPDFEFNPCEANEDGEFTIIDSRFEVEIPCMTEVIEASFARAGYEQFQFDYTDASLLRSTLIDYALPLYYQEFWANEAVPDWFRNGLRDFYDVSVSARDLVSLQSAARNGNLLSLERISTDNSTLREVQERAMVLYIADQIGVPELFRFANNASTTDDFAQLYAETIGAPLSSLIPSISTWAFENSTESDFFYVPYLATTATPTATISNTPFPPTPTVTATVTSTPTITPSVTGVLSATPLPTLTYTDTPLPRTPTVTPRPAGSLSDPTAVPIQAENASNDDNIPPELLLLGSGVFLVLALLIFLFTRRGSQ